MKKVLTGIRRVCVDDFVTTESKTGTKDFSKKLDDNVKEGVLHDFHYNDNNYQIVKTKHISDLRGDQKYQRDYGISDQSYKNIIINAIENGLNDFKGQGATVLVFKDFAEVKHSILVKIKDSGKVVIVSVFRGYKNDPRDHFIKVSNRIELDFIMPMLTEDEKQTKKKLRELMIKDTNNEKKLKLI